MGDHDAHVCKPPVFRTLVYVAFPPAANKLGIGPVWRSATWARHGIP